MRSEMLPRQRASALCVSLILDIFNKNADLHDSYGIVVEDCWNIF